MENNQKFNYTHSVVFRILGPFCVYLLILEYNFLGKSAFISVSTSSDRAWRAVPEGGVTKHLRLVGEDGVDAHVLEHVPESGVPEHLRLVGEGGVDAHVLEQSGQPPVRGVFGGSLRSHHADPVAEEDVHGVLPVKEQQERH